MTHRDARLGALLSGALLLGIPLTEVLLGFGTPGPTHFIVALFGIGLLAVGWSARLR